MREYAYQMFCYETKPAQHTALLEFHSPAAAMLREFGDTVLLREFPNHPLDCDMRILQEAEWQRWRDYLQSVVPLTDRYPARYLYLCNLLLDEMLPLRKPHMSTWEDMQQGGVFAPWMVYDSYYTVSMCCFWFEVRNLRRNGMVHVMSKAMPQRCQTRKFDEIVQEVMTSSVRHARYLREWLVCTLMGQYEHVPSHAKLLLDQRDDLQTIARKAPFLLDDFIAECPWVLLFALRERMCYSIYDNPVFSKHVSLLFPLPIFQSIVHNTLNEVRHVIRTIYPLVRMMPDGSKRLFESSTCKQLEKICKSAHKQILRVSYQRQRLPLMHTLHACKRDKSGKFDMRTLEPVGPGEDPMAQLTPAQRKAFHTKPWLSHEVMTVLHRRIQSIDPMTASLSDEIFNELPHFGVPVQAVQDMREIEYDHDHHRLGKRKLKQQLNDFQAQYPYSFYLMQVACLLWCRQRTTLTYELPYHYVQHQLEAICRKVDLDPRISVPADRLFFDFCGVCGQIYSLQCDLPRHSSLGFAGWLLPGNRHKRKSPKIVVDPRVAASATTLAKGLASGEIDMETQFDEQVELLSKRIRAGVLVDPDDNDGEDDEEDDDDEDVKWSGSTGSAGQHPLLLESGAPCPTLLPCREVMEKWITGLVNRVRTRNSERCLEEMWTRPGESVQEQPGHLATSADLAKTVEMIKAEELRHKNRSKRNRRTRDNVCEYGFNDVVMDYFTDTMHCGSDAQNGHMRCSEQNLSSVLLLGRLLTYKRSLILLCPGCGVSMSYHPRFCAVTERGVVCANCTAELRQQRFEATRVVPSLDQTQMRCELCEEGGVLSEKSTCYIYPELVFLCKNHHNRSLRQFIESQVFASRDDVIKQMILFRKTQLKNRRQAYKGRNRAVLQQQRRLTRERPTQRYYIKS